MYEDKQTEIDYFSRLDRTWFTLFQLMTLDAWTGVVREVMVTYSWSWILFLAYIILTGIIVTNIVIAIICDSVLSMNQEKEKEEEVEIMSEKMKKMLAEVVALRDEIDRKIGCNDGGLEHVQSNPSPLHASFTASYSLDGQSLLPSKRGSQRNSITKNETPRNSIMVNYHPGGFRQKCGDFVNKSSVQIFIISLIIVNSLMMAIGTFNFVEDDPSVSNAFDITDTVFLSIYTLESALQLVYHGVYIYKDGWATFDLLLVAISWGLAYTSIPVQAARSLRIIRILRLVPKLKSLQLLITAVLSVLPKLAGIAGILGLVYYVFAIIFTVLFQEYELSDDYFSRLDTTLFTLFQIMTMADWSEIARELAGFVPWAPIPIIIFIVVSGFIFLNLIIALICEAMGSIHELLEESDDNDEVMSLGGESVVISNEDRLQYIEITQREIRDMLQNCKIIPNPPQSILEDDGQVFLDASSDWQEIEN